MKKYLCGFAIILIGLLIVFAPFGFAQVCPPKPDGGFMKCYWMGSAVRLLGGLVAVLGVIFTLLKTARIGIAISNIGLSASLILLATTVIGTCQHAGMSCNLHTKPVILLLAIILMIINILYLFMNRKSLVLIR